MRGAQENMIHCRSFHSMRSAEQCSPAKTARVGQTLALVFGLLSLAPAAARALAVLPLSTLRCASGFSCSSLS